MPEIIIEDAEGGEYTEYRPRHRHHHHHRHHSSDDSPYHACIPCLAWRWPRMHSTARFRLAAIISIPVLLLAFVLFLLPAVSLPLLKPIYLVDIAAATRPGQPPTDVATDLRFGVWGFCASSALNAPTVLTNDGECTSPKLGYTIPPEVASLASLPAGVTDAIEETLTFVLVLHPIAAGLSLFTLLVSLFAHRSAAATIWALILGVITAIVGSAVLAIDVALVLVASDEVQKELGDQVVVSFGNAVWMIVVAVALAWLGVIILSAIACRCCGIRRKHGWYGDGYYG